MTQREIGWLAGSAVPVLVAGAIPVLIGRTDHSIYALLSLVLCWPAMVLTYWVTKKLARRHPMGGLLGMMVGAPVRLAVALGGGMVIFFGIRWVEGSPVGFLMWLLAAYLPTLVAETVLLATPLPVLAGVPRTGGD